MLQGKPYGPIDWWTLGCITYEMLVGRRSDRRTWACSYGRSSRRVSSSWLALRRRHLHHPAFLQADASLGLGASPHGASAVKSAAFFSGVDWAKLFAREVKAAHPHRRHLAPRRERQRGNLGEGAELLQREFTAWSGAGRPVHAASGAHEASESLSEQQYNFATSLALELTAEGDLGHLAATAPAARHLALGAAHTTRQVDDPERSSLVVDRTCTGRRELAEALERFAHLSARLGADKPSPADKPDASPVRSPRLPPRASTPCCRRCRPHDAAAAAAAIARLTALSSGIQGVAAQPRADAPRRPAARSHSRRLQSARRLIDLSPQPADLSPQPADFFASSHPTGGHEAPPSAARTPPNPRPPARATSSPPSRLMVRVRMGASRHAPHTAEWWRRCGPPSRQPQALSSLAVAATAARERGGTAAARCEQRCEQRCERRCIRHPAACTLDDEPSAAARAGDASLLEDGGPARLPALRTVPIVNSTPDLSSDRADHSIMLMLMEDVTDEEVSKALVRRR